MFNKRMFRHAFPAVAAMLLPVFAAAGQAKSGGDDMLTVAVAEFRTNGFDAKQDWLGRSFADGLISGLSKGRSVRIVEREFLDQVMKELKLQSSAAVDEKTAVQLGRLLGAKVFVFGSVVPAGPDDILARARVVSVERGEVLNVAEATGPLAKMLEVQRDLAREVATSAAVDAALEPNVGLEITGDAIEIYHNLDRLSALARTVPFFDLDPARARRQADYQTALSLAEQIRRAAPKLAKAQYYTALFNLQMGDLDAADAASRIVMQLTPTDVDAMLVRGRVLLEMKDVPGATAVYREATRRAPEDSRPWYALGRIALNRSDKAEAIADYVNAIERSPTIQEADANLETIIGGGASGAAEVSALTDPDVAAAARVLRAVYIGGKGAPEADRLMAVNRRPRLYAGYLEKGLGEFEQNKLAEAEADMTRALSLRPTAPVIHRALALVDLKAGKCEDGKLHVALYRGFSTYLPDDPALDKEVERCRPR
jgi:tetratricopeptide (TPR) repeat protein